MSKKQFLVILIAGIVFAFLGGMLSDGLKSAGASPDKVEKADKKQVEKSEGADLQKKDKPGKGICDYLAKEGLFIGIVENGRFRMVAPKPALGGFARLTGIQMQESVPPESRELDLTALEGKAIMISGHNGGGWIYRAAVVDKGGPLLTVLVRQAFDK